MKTSSKSRQSSRKLRGGTTAKKQRKTKDAPASGARSGKGLAVKKRVDWASIDWSRRAEDIAKSTGWSLAYVYRKRREHARSGVTFGRRERKNVQFRSRFDWDSVDWNESNARIAEKLGCTAPAVGYRRRRMSDIPGRTSPRYDWSEVDWSLPNSQIAKDLGCTRQAVWLKRVGK